MDVKNADERILSVLNYPGKSKTFLLEMAWAATKPADEPLMELLVGPRNGSFFIQSNTGPLSSRLNTF